MDKNSIHEPMFMVMVYSGENIKVSLPNALKLENHRCKVIGGFGFEFYSGEHKLPGTIPNNDLLWARKVQWEFIYTCNYVCDIKCVHSCSDTIGEAAVHSICVL